MLREFAWRRSMRQDIAGRVHVEFMDPNAVLELVDKPEIKLVANDVRQRLERVMGAVQAGEIQGFFRAPVVQDICMKQACVAIHAALLSLLITMITPVLAQAPVQGGTAVPTDAQVRELEQQIKSLQQQRDELKAAPGRHGPTTTAAAELARYAKLYGPEACPLGNRLSVDGGTPVASVAPA